MQVMWVAIFKDFSSCPVVDFVLKNAHIFAKECFTCQQVDLPHLHLDRMVAYPIFAFGDILKTGFGFCLSI